MSWGCKWAWLYSDTSDSTIDFDGEQIDFVGESANESDFDGEQIGFIGDYATETNFIGDGEFVGFSVVLHCSNGSIEEQLLVLA